MNRVRPGSAIEEVIVQVVENERKQVRELGSRIGYGRTMQLCEQIWEEEMVAKGHPAGSAHSSYCCVGFLVPCPSLEHRIRTSCDWCCGAGRVTRRVAEAISLAEKDLLEEVQVESVMDS